MTRRHLVVVLVALLIVLLIASLPTQAIESDAALLLEQESELVVQLLSSDVDCIGIEPGRNLELRTL